MKKDTNNIDLTVEKPKKGLFKKLFNPKSNQKEILEYINKNKIKNLLYYTDVDNILQILDTGILLTKDFKKINPKLKVFTHLENDNSIGLEFDNSTRANFWNWASDNQLDITKISVVAINPEKLANLSKEDWAFDKIKNIVYLYELIDKNSIDWIMIKDKKNLQRIYTIIDSNDLNIKVFLGEKGHVEQKGKE